MKPPPIIKGYKINLKNRDNLRDAYGSKIKFSVYVLPMVDQKQKLWNAYIVIEEYDLIEDVVGVFQKDIPDVEEWIANLDENGYFDSFKEELATQAY